MIIKKLLYLGMKIKLVTSVEDAVKEGTKLSEEAERLYEILYGRVPDHTKSTATAVDSYQQEPLIYNRIRPFTKEEASCFINRDLKVRKYPNSVYKYVLYDVGESYVTIQVLNANRSYHIEDTYVDYRELLEKYTFGDDTSCGICVENRYI